MEPMAPRASRYSRSACIKPLAELDDHAYRHGSLACSEIGDLLWHIVLEDAEVAFRDMGNKAAFVIEHGYVDVDYAGVDLEIRLVGNRQLVFAGQLGWDLGLLRLDRIALLARSGHGFADIFFRS